MISEEFQQCLDKHGGLYDVQKLSAEEIQAIPEFLPKDLRELYKAYGPSLYRQGRLTICDPIRFRKIAAIIFGADSDFNHENTCIISYTIFGRLNALHGTYGPVEIDLLYGEIYCRGLTGFANLPVNSDWNYIQEFSLDDEDYDCYDANGDDLLPFALEKLGPVEYGDCFGFFPALAMGGESNLDNLKRVKAYEHFAMIAQMTSFNLFRFTGNGTEREVVRRVG